MTFPGCPPVGAWFFPEGSAPELVSAFSEAEQIGLDEIWIGDEGPANRDPFVILAGAATRTERLRLGVAVTNPFLRHPAVTASGMMSIQELSRGRALLGIGPGGVVALGPLGISRQGALARTREAVRIIRAVAAGEPTEGFTPPSEPFTVPSLPVFIGSRGEAFNRYASEAADGVFLGGIPFAMLDTVLSWVRSVRPIDVAMYPSIAFDDDELEWARPQFVFAFLDAPHSTRALAQLSEQELREAVDAFEGGDDGPARRLITDGVLSQIAMVGSPEHIGVRLATLVQRYRPSSIGLCIRTAGPFHRRLADIEAVFGAMSKELSR